jgi:two-component system sensor histidine kinase DegS
MYNKVINYFSLFTRKENVMQNFKVNASQMDEIINKTIKALDSGKKEIFEIAENSRKECKRLEEELEMLKFQVRETSEYIEKLEKDLKDSRRRLYLVNKEFGKFSQEELQEAYQQADNLRVELAVKREQERYLMKRRNDLEVRIKDSVKTLDHADNLISHVSIALGYLSSDLQGVSEQLNNLQQKQFLGLKIIRAQEEERKRVAREIHDGPAQSMSNVVIKAEICEKLIDKNIEDARNELRNLKTVMRESLQEVRKIIYNLRPMALDDIGLLPTLERYVVSFKEDNKIDVNIKATGVKDDIDNVISLTVFRVVQEALNNILKHSKAHSASILLECANNKLRIHIVDDGIGFDTSSVKISLDSLHGFGLASMRERIELLDGEFEITSGKNIGTRLKILIPLINKEEDVLK